MKAWILKKLDSGEPRVYPTPAAWLTLKEWYQYVLREVRDVAEWEYENTYISKYPLKMVGMA